MDKIKNKQKERIFKSISTSLAELGFQRTKSTFWVKELNDTIQFIHIHTFSFDYSFRIHLGIRVKNDSFDAKSLNGPYTFDGWWKSKSLFNKKRKLEFNEKDYSIKICVKNIIDFISKIGLPWFTLFADSNELLNNIKSPLNLKEKELLIEMKNGNAETKNIELSLKLFRLEK